MFQVHCFLFLSFLHPRWLAKIFVINTIYCLVNDFGVSKSRYDWSTCWRFGKFPNYDFSMHWEHSTCYMPIKWLCETSWVLLIWGLFGGWRKNPNTALVASGVMSCFNNFQHNVNPALPSRSNVRGFQKVISLQSNPLQLWLLFVYRIFPISFIHPGRCRIFTLKSASKMTRLHWTQVAGNSPEENAIEMRELLKGGFGHQEVPVSVSFLHGNLHTPKMNGWNLKITSLKRKNK